MLTTILTAWRSLWRRPDKRPSRRSGRYTWQGCMMRSHGRRRFDQLASFRCNGCGRRSLRRQCADCDLAVPVRTTDELLERAPCDAVTRTHRVEVMHG